MKSIILIAAALLSLHSCSTLDMTSITSAGSKAIQALSVTDAQIESYTKQFIDQSDKENVVLTGTNSYAVRLNKITKNFNNKEGINIKAYKSKDVNAFACADGSVRVYSGLMDIMSDEEILGVVGHEIGHVKNKDTRDAFKNSLFTSALRDAISSAGGTVAVLSTSQLGDLGESFLSANYSQKQEYAADQYGYDFLKRNGVNPWAMAMSFEKLAAMEASTTTTQSSAVQQLFSTHPDITARLKIMSDKAKTEGYVRPVTKK